MHRIVSLIASSTEIVCALGCANLLVGRSHECDYPPHIRHLPLCTEVKFGTHGTSYDIDQRVKAILQEGLSVYRVRADVLRELAPTLIITQTQCEVCAVSLKDVQDAVCELVDPRAKIVSLHPNGLDDIWADIRRVAEALEIPERGEQLVTQLSQRMREIEQRATAAGSRPRVACIEWVDPLMAAGNWMPTLVRMAGGENLFGVENAHSPWMRWEDLVATDPDVIIVLPCGFDIPRAMQDMPLLAKRSEWPRLKAVREGNVFIADGNQYFNRPGPRVVESLEIMAELLHPELFDFGHEGQGWVRWKGVPS